MWNILPVRQVMAVVFLVIFAVANYAVQTHVHGNDVPQVLSASAPVASGSGAPVGNDEQDCPLCQSFLSDGSFLTPATVFVLPLLTLGAVAVSPAGRVIAHGLSHGWQGRGPPSV